MVLPQTQHLPSCRANTCCLNLDGILSFGGETLTFQGKSGPLYSSPNPLYRLSERDRLGYDITHPGYNGIPVFLPISSPSVRSFSSHLSRVKERSFSAATSHSGERDLAESQTSSCERATLKASRHDSLSLAYQDSASVSQVIKCGDPRFVFSIVSRICSFFKSMRRAS